MFTLVLALWTQRKTYCQMQQHENTFSTYRFGTGVRKRFSIKYAIILEKIQNAFGDQLLTHCYLISQCNKNNLTDIQQGNKNLSLFWKPSKNLQDL